MRSPGRPTHGVRQLGPRHRIAIYLSGALLLVSGAGWLVARYVLRASTGDPDLPHPSELWWLRLHGAAVIGFLVAFGGLLPGHVLYGWRHHFNRGSGATLLGVAFALALTGYGLYYVGDDRWRATISVSHWVVGLVAAAGLLWHVIAGRRLLRRSRADESTRGHRR
ncbi:MAG: hypothetical protein JSR73_07940 [Proteobacteria bacterium]|nr:hypothetical protein [Pseudomonadota bacterium]